MITIEKLVIKYDVPLISRKPDPNGGRDESDK